jgi:hypothetical protein
MDWNDLFYGSKLYGSMRSKDVGRQEARSPPGQTSRETGRASEHRIPP